MAKISTYSTSTPTLNDIVIGSAVADSNETKNFRLGDIATLFSGGTYVPYTGATSNVNLGAYSLSARALTITDNLIANSSAGTSGYVLKSMGANVSPQWVALSSLITSNTFKGSFYDSIAQTITTPQLATGIPVILRTTDATCTNGISIVTDGTNLTRITFANAGTYNLLFSAQLSNSGGTGQTVDFWLRKNGTTAAANIADTNGKVQLQANATFLMAAWNYFINVNAGDYIQLMWVSTSTNVSIAIEAANGVHPATPSVILTLNQV